MVGRWVSFGAQPIFRVLARIRHRQLVVSCVYVTFHNHRRARLKIRCYFHAFGRLKSTDNFSFRLWYLTHLWYDDAHLWLHWSAEHRTCRGWRFPPPPPKKKRLKQNHPTTINRFSKYGLNSFWSRFFIDFPKSTWISKSQNEKKQLIFKIWFLLCVFFLYSGESKATPPPATPTTLEIRPISSGTCENSALSLNGKGVIKGKPGIGFERKKTCLRTEHPPIWMFPKIVVPPNHPF